ncbi:glyoxalase [uncultured Polaribacter sp.]|uniref:glyoxalase n=1 Tax=uncultured Polaribacter sp. TaxID=174711 RepID=UPI00263523DA|nr:glyoxalase [uncultured Polaribacter sp.]
MNKERPVLENLLKENMSELEIFQNTTLRPVIKMQHSLLIHSFKNYLQKRKIDFTSLTDQKKRSKIKGVFTKDINYKNFTLGCIVGAFSEEEYQLYAPNSSEIHRRILQIIIQRIQDSILEIS